MTDRITTARLATALETYSRALDSVDFPHDPASLRVEAPYGHVWYVLRRDEENRLQHDLPGFCGSYSSGFVRKRDLYVALLTAAHVLFDLACARESAQRLEHQTTHALAVNVADHFTQET